MKNILLFSNNTDPADCRLLEQTCMALRASNYTVYGFSDRRLRNTLDSRFLTNLRPQSSTRPLSVLSETALMDIDRCGKIYGIDIGRERVSSLAALYYRLFNILNPGVLLVWNDVWPKHRIAVEVSRTIGIDVLVLERSPWPGVISLDTRGFNCNAAYCDELRLSDCSEVLDCSLSESIAQSIASGSMTWWPTNRDLHQNLPPKKASCSILFVEQLDQDANCQLWGGPYKSNMAALSDVVEASNALPNSEVVWRRHPKSRIDAALDIQQNPNIRVEGNRPIHESLRDADVVIGVNSASLFEAVLSNKPTIALGQTVLSGLGVFLEPGTKSIRSLLISAVNQDRCSTERSRAKMIRALQLLLDRGRLFPARAPFDKYTPNSLSEHIIRHIAPKDSSSSVFATPIRLSATINTILREIRNKAIGHR